MWQLTSVTWWELIVRACIVYAFLLITLRLSGKRQIGQMSPFDLVLLLVLSNAVQNAMNGGENSLLGGLILATTLIALNYGMGWATYKSRKIEAMVEGRPEILIHNGKLFTHAMEKQMLTHNELESALHAAGCSGVEDVRFAVLENNGKITVQPRNKTDAAGQHG